MNYNYGGYFYNCSQMQQLPYNNGSENRSLPGGNEGSPQNRWKNQQTDKLVELGKSLETWLKIRTEINKLGKEKTVLLCIKKILNLKNIYKYAKENNAKTGSFPTFLQYFHNFDKVLGCRAVVIMLEMIEIGQVCLSADVSVLLSLIQTIVSKAKKMAYCAQKHLLSSCLLIFSPSFSRYCKNLRRVTQFVKINFVKKTVQHTRA